MSHIPLRKKSGKVVIDDRDNSSDIVVFENDWTDLPLDPTNTTTPPSPFFDVTNHNPPDTWYSRTTDGKMKIEIGPTTDTNGPTIISSSEVGIGGIDISARKGISISAKMSFDPLSADGLYSMCLYGFFFSDGVNTTNDRIVLFSNGVVSSTGVTSFYTDYNAPGKITVYDGAFTPLAQIPTCVVTTAIDVTTKPFFRVDAEIYEIDDQWYGVRQYVDNKLVATGSFPASLIITEIGYPTLWVQTNDPTNAVVYIDDYQVQLIQTPGRNVANTSMSYDGTNFTNPATGGARTGFPGQVIIDQITEQRYEFDTTNGWQLQSSSTTDPNAIHTNVAGEIAGITEKIIPSTTDVMIIEDSANANAKAKVKVGNILSLETFTNLSDTPSTFLGNANKYVRVNALETALEFNNPPLFFDALVGSSPDAMYPDVASAVANGKYSILVEDGVSETSNFSLSSGTRIYLLGAWNITDITITIPGTLYDNPVMIIGSMSRTGGGPSTIITGSTGGNITHFIGSGANGYVIFSNVYIDYGTNATLSSCSFQTFENVRINSYNNFISFNDNAGRFIMNNCVIFEQLSGTNILNITASKYCQINNLVVDNLSGSITITDPNAQINNLSVDGVGTVTLAGEVTNYITNFATTVLSDSMIITNADFGIGSGGVTFANYCKFANAKFKSTNNYSISTNHNRFEQCEFTNASVNVSGNYNTFIGVSVGDVTIGGGIDTINFSVGTTGNIAVGCHTDAPISGSGTFSANVVF